MAKFSNFTLTTQGGELLALAQKGELINFTKVAVGDGELGTNQLTDLTALINQKQDANLTKVNVSGNKVVLRVILSNKNTTEDFYLRELGVFAKDSLGNEILYAVGNAGTEAELFSAYGGSVVLMKVWDLVFSISNTSSVTAMIDETAVYVTRDEFEEHTNNNVFDPGGVHGFETDQPTDDDDKKNLAWDKTNGKYIHLLPVITKKYESDWRAVSTLSNYTFTHNLGVLPILFCIYARSADGTIAKCRYWDYDTQSELGVLITNITTTSFLVRTGNYLTNVDDSLWGNGATNKASTHIKIICFA